MRLPHIPAGGAKSSITPVEDAGALGFGSVACLAQRGHSKLGGSLRPVEKLHQWCLVCISGYITKALTTT